MGTRADFYVGNGKEAEWIGSTAWDGDRGGIVVTLKEKEKFAGIEINKHAEFPEGKHLFDSTTEKEFRERVAQYFENRDDVTLPDMGWPWPWDDSATSDCSYWFFGGQVFDEHDKRYTPCSEDIPGEDDEWDKWLESKEPIQFPNMSGKKKVTLGKRSGLIVVSG